MASEIERKFLLAHAGWRNEVASSQRIKQGYLSRAANAAIRVRVHGASAELNVKSTRDGIHRQEFEYAIPLHDAEAMLEEVALRPWIDKTRHLVRRGGHLWEIDEFHGANTGLVVAEIELAHADEEFERPDWLGEEVSTDPRYYNSNLSERPYSTW
jgi:adenylate cyclase